MSIREFIVILFISIVIGLTAQSTPLNIVLVSICVMSLIATKSEEKTRRKSTLRKEIPKIKYNEGEL